MQVPEFGARRTAGGRKEADMSTVATNGSSAKTAGVAPPPEYESSYIGAGWIVLAAMMFVIAATLNFVWGIAAVAGSRFFVDGVTYILSVLNTLGWIAIGLGGVQLLAALSIWRGGAFGRWFGIVAAGVAVIGAMMMIPAYPLWALTLVALDVLVIHGLAVYGGKPDLLDQRLTLTSVGYTAPPSRFTW
jgi:hypothetical protein